jgi:hypothetical protein
MFFAAMATALTLEARAISSGKKRVFVVSVCYQEARCQGRFSQAAEGDVSPHQRGYLGSGGP